MKQVSMKQVGIVTLLGIVLMFGYHFYRQTTSSQISEELREARDKTTRKQLVALEVQEKRQKLSGPSDVASFVESLYQTARQTNVLEHEVITSPRRDQSSARRSRKSRRQAPGAGLKINRLQVTFSGEYRNVAEYVKKVQQLDRIKQVVRFDMSTDKETIKALLLLDLYALKEGEES